MGDRMTDAFTRAELDDIDTWVDYSGLTIEETRRATATIRTAWAERDAAREALRAIRVELYRHGYESETHRDCAPLDAELERILLAALAKDPE